MNTNEAELLRLLDDAATLARDMGQGALVREILAVYYRTERLYLQPEDET